MTEEELAEAAAKAVTQIGRQLGAEIVPEGTDPAQLLAPAAALRVARQVELAARRDRRPVADHYLVLSVRGNLGYGLHSAATTPGAVHPDHDRPEH